MEEATINTDESYDSFDEQNYERPAERWAPLGAAVSPIEINTYSEVGQLKQLEREQEQLNSYLLSLTTHFAQVQFRLKQIVNAPVDGKEHLLKELEEFAFQGVPDVQGYTFDNENDMVDEGDRGLKISIQREKQKELIDKLKTQLGELETYAYETGEAELPTSQMMEKQKVIIDHMKRKMNLNLEHIDTLSSEELRQVVDHAIGQIVNPAKVKEKLVDQLKTQITDLERFIQFLQGEVSSPGPLGKERCTCSVHNKNQLFNDDGSDSSKECCVPPSYQKNSITNSKNSETLHRTTLSIVKKALAILQIFAITQFGCGGREFQRNLLKKTTKANHWGDLRAQLEVAIEKLLQMGREQAKENCAGSECLSDDSDESQSNIQSSPEITQAVRKDLAMAVKNLMQHGLVELGQSSSLVSWGCFPNRSAGITKMMHAWDLLLKYYEMKHGKEYNESPARKLSQSFHLDIVGGKPITAKQTLLGAIDTIMQSHAPLKRSEDSHFKAFVCLALNERKLVTWLRLIFRTQSLIDYYYQDWSYVARTGFDDALKSMDRMNEINFKLPVDLAVRPFSKIRDAF